MRKASDQNVPSSNVTASSPLADAGVVEYPIGEATEKCDADDFLELVEQWKQGKLKMVACSVINLNPQHNSASAMVRFVQVK